MDHRANYSLAWWLLALTMVFDGSGKFFYLESNVNPLNCKSQRYSGENSTIILVNKLFRVAYPPGQLW
jgi:hypothetical protein